MSYLALTVLCALIGGLWPALTAAVVGSQLLNWFFTPPHHTFTIADPVNVGAVVVFLVVAGGVASVVDTAARRTVQADAATQEADTLTMLNRTLLGSDHDVPALLDLVTRTFAVESASLFRGAHDSWELVARSGEGSPSRPEEATITAGVPPTSLLALRGRDLATHEKRVLEAFAAHVGAVLERQELAARAAEAQLLEEGNRVRTALLAAVSHDLRTPLAGIKAAASSLRSPEVEWSAEDEAELLAAIEDSTDRLHSIVANLLDLSRLQTAGVHPLTREIGLDDVVSTALAGMPHAAGVHVNLPENPPSVVSDPALLERVIANLVENALRHSPGDERVSLSMSRSGDRAQLNVVDHGSGVPDASKERMFEPFQRLGDSDSRGGIGLGLAVAKGLTEAVGGRLTARDTPGGGLTMTIDLPTAAPGADRLAASSPA